MYARRVKTVYRAIKILEILGSEGSMGVSEISRRLKFPKSSTFELLSTLEGEGILERDRYRNSYRLGLKLFELGTQAQTELEIRKVSIPYLKALNRELDETVHLTVMNEMDVLYIECFESTKRLRTYSVIGVRAPMSCTAVGKAILAYLTSEEVDAIIKAKGFRKYTGTTLTTRKALLEDLEKTRQRGYSIDNMEHEEGVRCVGVPVWDHSGRVSAAISVSGRNIEKTGIPRRTLKGNFFMQTLLQS